MKILLLIMLPILSLSQIKVQESPKKVDIGETRRAGSMLASVSYYPEKDTLINIMFKNDKYSALNDYQSVSFYGGLQEVNDLYNALLSEFTKEPGHSIEVKLDDKQTVTVMNKRSMGMDIIWFWTNRGYVVLKKKDVNKMFGK
jgi:hypothetical protein